jgi:betaine-aldehyde dehydrogenase
MVGSAPLAVKGGWVKVRMAKSSSANLLTPVGPFDTVFHHKQSGARCATNFH